MTYDELTRSILTAQGEMLKHKIEANSVTLNGRKYGKLVEDCPPNMKPTIFGMAVKADYTMPDDYDFLVQYEPPHPQTNADKFRSMSDEDLAWAIVVGCTGRQCPESCREELSTIEDAERVCQKCWIGWLKQEAL